MQTANLEHPQPCKIDSQSVSVMETIAVKLSYPNHTAVPQPMKGKSDDSADIGLSSAFSSDSSDSSECEPDEIQKGAIKSSSCTESLGEDQGGKSRMTRSAIGDGSRNQGVIISPPPPPKKSAPNWDG